MVHTSMLQYQHPGQATAATYSDVLNLFCTLTGHIQDHKLGYEFDGIDYSLALNACCQVLTHLISFGKKQHQHQKKNQNNNINDNTSSFAIDLSKLCWMTQPTQQQTESNMKYFLECAKNFSRIVCSSQQQKEKNNNNEDEPPQHEEQKDLMYFFSLGNKNTRNKLPRFPGFDHNGDEIVSDDHHGNNNNSHVFVTNESVNNDSSNTAEDGAETNNEETVDKRSLGGGDGGEDQQLKSDAINNNNTVINHHQQNKEKPNIVRMMNTNNNDITMQNNANRVSLLHFALDTMKQDRKNFMHHMQIQNWIFSVFVYLMDEYTASGGSTTTVTNNINNNNNSNHHHHQYLIALFQNNFATSSCSPEKIRSYYREEIPQMSRCPSKVLEIAEMTMEEKKGYRGCWRETERAILIMLEKGGDVDWKKVQSVFENHQPTKAMNLKL